VPPGVPRDGDRDRCEPLLHCGRRAGGKLLQRHHRDGEAVQAVAGWGRQITGFAGPGHFLGLATSSTYAFSAEAIEPVRFCRFSRSKLRGLVGDFLNLERRQWEVAATELVAAQEQMPLLGCKTAKQRLASFLLLQMTQDAPCAEKLTQITLSMTRGDIADYLGLMIETVSRTLSRLRADRLIDIPTTNDVVIRSRAALEQLAGGMN
jgi:CRP/FNR family transcriptional regulator